VDIYYPIISYTVSEGVTLSLQASFTTIFFQEGCYHFEVAPYDSVLTSQGIPRVVQGFQNISLESGDMRAISIRDETVGLIS
jgi:hypothetical protein